MKRILVDTSVWVQHFQRGNPTLRSLLALDAVLSHPLVLLEIACGTPPSPRAQILHDMELLQPAQQASVSEVGAFIEREALFGQGCGAVDLLLLASTLLTPNASLWTLDKRLAALAERFEVGFSKESL
jgi:predicted nucleic acid-binding protein